MPNLTIAIPVRNEERNLDVCLQAIGLDFAHRVVVIDSASTDSTVAVARRHGAEVIEFDWDGGFPKKRNWFLRHHTPTTPWVLFLDADEIISPQVKREITEALLGTTHQGFLLTYTNYFLGRRLRGGYPLRKIALFRVGEVEYEYIHENQWSSCDMEVHEHPIIEGSVGLIRSRIDHRDLRGIDSYMRKHNEYAAWEANRIVSYRRSTFDNTTITGKWSFQQHLKYGLINSPFAGLAFFFFSFFCLGGWRDGTLGFSFAMLKAAYYIQISCRIRELQKPVI